MGDTEKRVVADFLTINWSAFIAFAASHGINEARCDDIANELGNAKYESQEGVN